MSDLRLAVLSDIRAPAGENLLRARCGATVPMSGIENKCWEGVDNRLNGFGRNEAQLSRNQCPAFPPEALHVHQAGESDKVSGKSISLRSDEGGCLRLCSSA